MNVSSTYVYVYMCLPEWNRWHTYMYNVLLGLWERERERERVCVHVSPWVKQVAHIHVQCTDQVGLLGGSSCKSFSDGCRRPAPPLRYPMRWQLGMEGLNKELRFTHNRGADLHYPNEVKWVQLICLLCFCLFTLYFSHAHFKYKIKGERETVLWSIRDRERGF